MTTAEARDKIKSRLNIDLGVTTWDDLIEDFVGSAVLRLYPRAKLEKERILVDPIEFNEDGEIVIATDDPTPFREARKVECLVSDSWVRVTDTYHHQNYLHLRGVDSNATQIRIFPLSNFTSITEVYDWLLQAVIWYAMAEFYDYLAGNKKNYNAYMQATGARAVDNMADQSAYYDTKADRYVDEQNQSYGL